MGMAAIAKKSDEKPKKNKNESEKRKQNGDSEREEPICGSFPDTRNTFHITHKVGKKKGVK